MSEIDKSLPNVEQEIKLPSEEEIVEASQENIEEQVGPEDVQIEREEDGSATITFFSLCTHQPGAVPILFGIAFADGMSQACLMLVSGISFPRATKIFFR